MCSKHVRMLVWLVPRVMDASADGYQAADLWIHKFKFNKKNTHEEDQ